MSDRLKISLPVVVEGRYDKSTLASVIDARIITLEGFAVFNSKEKQALIRRVGQGGLILLTDPDGGGTQIRSFIRSILPKDKVYNLYIPKIPGKERRKNAPSRAGLLGVEGMSADLLRELFLPFVGRGRDELCPEDPVTKMDMYLRGMSGGPDAKTRRAALAEALGLPQDMTANSLLDAINVISGREEFDRLADELFGPRAEV